MNQENVHDLQLAKWLGAAALGAAVMYLLDPERGAPRRAASGARLRQLGRQTGDTLDKVVHQLGSRLADVPVTASELISQAMATTAPAASAPSMPAPGVEQRAMDAGQTQGYGGTLHGRPYGSAAGAAPPGQAWGGGRRGAALAGGGALGLAGLLAPRSPLTLLIGLAGLTLLARGATNRPLRSMLSGSTVSAPVLVEKSIRIEASPEQVYDLFANYENFPRYLSNVVEVRDLGNLRSHWVVKGPAGTEFSWNAVLTDHSRPRRLAWESEPGAEVQQWGEILFEPVRSGTRVTVRLSYRPPAGVVGHAVATLLGSDPKRQLDQDLTRMKGLVERDAIAHGAAHGGGHEHRVLH